MQHTPTSLESKETVGIKGIHRLSVCDARHPLVKAASRDVALFSERQEALVREQAARMHRALAKANGVFGFLRRGELEAEAADAAALIRKISDAKHEGLKQLYALMRSLALVDDRTLANIIPTAGRAVVARWLTGDNTYTAASGANYGSVGTGTTTPSNSDTQLATETFRKARSSQAQSTNVATLSVFYAAGDFNGTVQECGWHIAGTGTANTGQLLSRFLTGGVSKSATQTLTEESTLTVS